MLMGRYSDVRKEQSAKRDAVSSWKDAKLQQFQAFNGH